MLLRHPEIGVMQNCGRHERLFRCLFLDEGCGRVAKHVEAEFSAAAFGQ
jgi:hypothetical protein